MMRCATIIFSTVLFLSAGPPSRAGDKKQVLSALGSAELGIVRAVLQCEERYRAVAVEIEAETRRDKVVWEVELVSPDKERTVKVDLDMKSGKVLEQHITFVHSMFLKDDDRRAVDAAVENGFGLVQAIELARRHVSGTVCEAEMEYENGIAFIKVETRGPDGKQKVIVNIETKAIIPVLKKR